MYAFFFPVQSAKPGGTIASQFLTKFHLVNIRARLATTREQKSALSDHCLQRILGVSVS